MRTTGKQQGGVTGKGFVPGKSGNPGGRPKGVTAAVRELVGDDGGAALGLMAKIMRGEKIGKHTPTIRDRMEAAEWLIDRGFGKATQVSEVSVKRETRFIRAAEVPEGEEPG